jgi:uncharacterized protein YbaP (TraB family)
VVRDGAAEVFLYGDGAPPPTPWRSARVEAAFNQSAVFWKETPDPGPDSMALSIAKGVDRTAPLSTWLTPQQHDRVAAAAVAVGTTYGFLEPFRPWLAGQALNSFLVRRFSPGPANGATAMAKAAGKPIRTEMPDAAAQIGLFSGFSRVAEVQYLLMAVDWIEQGPDMWRRRGEAWAAGDLSLEAWEVRHMIGVYPELYQQYVVVRNRRWPGRFRTMLDGGGTTFILVGGDHLVGPDSVLIQLARAGMRPRRI